MSATEFSKLPNLPELPGEVAPTWREVSVGNASLTATAHVPRTLAIFNDHFQSNPLLPGVVQLLWLQALAEQAWPERYQNPALTSSRLTGHQRVKFKKPVLPGDDLAIKLTCKDAVIAFSIDSAAGRCTDGQLTYQPAQLNEQSS